MLNRIKITLQFWLPKLAMTRLAGWLAEKEAGWFTEMLIKLFIRCYRVNMSEALHANPQAYRTFNEFFTRPLKEDARPIVEGENWLALPADGTISQIGPIEENLLLQAKGHHYTLEALLAGNDAMAKLFNHGLFATIYLSPRDYHRVHMPCSGTLREMIYVPGDLFSVSPLTAENIPNLFARNERVICLFDTALGPMAQILVGATIVGSIETFWAKTVTPPRQGIIQRWTYPRADEEGAITLSKGAEMGRFKLGSTVITLFTANQIKFSAHLQNAVPTRMGEPFAQRLTDARPK